jgi:hypothetical protein
MKLEFKRSVDIGGKTINLLETTTAVKTKRWLLMFLGWGQKGPADGSQILDLDDYGYQKFPLFETEFNIMCPQAVETFNESDPFIQQYMIRTYGEDIQIFMAGHSFGGRNVMEYINGYGGNLPVKQVVGFMPIAGEMSYPLPVDPCTCADKPIFAYHGQNDGVIGTVQSKKLVDLVNSCPTRVHKAELRIVPGQDHTSIMKYVFEPSREAEGYKTIMSCFAPEQKEIPGKIVLINGEIRAIFDDGTTKVIESH